MPPAGGRCPDCGFDPSRVSPSDAAVAARSFPRRFRALLVRPDDEDPAVVHRRPAGGGPSAAGHALAAAAGMAAAAGALGRVLTADDPTVDLGPGPPTAADEPAPEVDLSPGPPPAADEPVLEVVPDRVAAAAADEPVLEVVLDRVAAAAGVLAAAVEATSASEWARPGRLPGGEEVTALGVARAGVHAGAHHLRAAERALARAR